MKFSTEHLNKVFTALEASENGCTADEFKNLMFDVSRRELDGISAKEANEQIRKVAFDILGLEYGKKPTDREIKRAMKRHGQEFFEIIEEVIDEKISVGFQDSMFFDQFVDSKNIAEGDGQEFWNSTDVDLVVAKTAGSNHDITIQRLGEGESTTVGIVKYTIAVGDDLKKFLLGRKDLAELTDKAAEAMVRQAQTDIYAQVMSVENQLPLQDTLKKTLPIVAANKDTFDDLIQKIESVNESGVVIMGTKTALKKLTNFADVDWASEEQKKQINDFGRLGSYEGTTLVEIPQRYKDKTLAQELVDSSKLLIMPNIDNKFIKFVDSGETEITEKNEAADYLDDGTFYQIERGFGVATMITSYFGVWVITD